MTLRNNTISCQNSIIRKINCFALSRIILQLINILLLVQQFEMSKEEEKPVNLDQDQEDKDDKDDPAMKGLTKGQKKKLRQKRKKQQQAAKAKIQKQEKTELNVDEIKGEVKQEGKGKAKGKKQPKLNAAAALAIKKQEEQKRFQEQQQRKRLQFEQEQQRKKKQQEQLIRLKQQEQKKRIEEIRKQIIEKKKKGTYVKKKDQAKLQSQRQQLELNQRQNQRQQDNDDDGQPTNQQIQQILNEQKKKNIQSKILKDDRHYFIRRQGDYRSPVCCILGHVDTGKTTLLDKIRRTNVQQGEAGGITQQIGATFFPHEKLILQVQKCKSFYPVDVQVPGLLIIDTPGHESFSNLRSRGSSLCDIAILVIDLQHGLQNQTLQSLQLLSKRKTPFVVALNKIDRSYNWKSKNDHSSFLTLKDQAVETIDDYDSKLKKIILELNSKGYNAALYWQNQDPQQFISLVPTSGVTGEGIPDILSVIVKYSLTMESIKKRIKIKQNVFRCTVMEVKMIQGYGTTIDCMLVDGKIKKDDQIVILGFEGPIVTKVKAILTPHPMKEMRIKDQYLHHKQIWGANGIKIAAPGLDNAVAGTPLIVANTQDQVQDAKAICLNQFQSVKKKIKLQNLGVGVAASTLGSLQALLQYLSKQKIPVSYVTVGPVSKQDVMKAMKSMLSQIPERRKKQYACMLVFDIKVLADGQKYAQQNQIKIFTANIIYHLTGLFTKEQRKLKQGKQAVFPCVLKQVALFRKSDPIVLGVDVQSGVIKVGTPIVVYRQKERGDKQVKLGVVESIQHNHKKLKEARKNTGSVAISIGGDPSIHVGRQFEQTDRLVSLITRRSIDCLKQHYRAEATKQDWQLIIELKKYFNIN